MANARKRIGAAALAAAVALSGIPLSGGGYGICGEP